MTLTYSHSLTRSRHAPVPGLCMVSSPVYTQRQFHVEAVRGPLAAYRPQDLLQGLSGVLLGS